MVILAVEGPAYQLCLEIARELVSTTRSSQLLERPAEMALFTGAVRDPAVELAARAADLNTTATRAADTDTTIVVAGFVTSHVAAHAVRHGLIAADVKRALRAADVDPAPPGVLTVHVDTTSGRLRQHLGRVDDRGVFEEQLLTWPSRLSRLIDLHSHLITRGAGEFVVPDRGEVAEIVTAVERLLRIGGEAPWGSS